MDTAFYYSFLIDLKLYDLTEPGPFFNVDGILDCYSVFFCGVFFLFLIGVYYNLAKIEELLKLWDLFNALELYMEILN